jgi:O-antigen polymerase
VPVKTTILTKQIIPFTLLLCIGASLINVDTFGEPSYFAYFFYAFFVCALAVLVCLDIIFSQNFQFRISLPVVFFLLLALYILLHGVITNTFWLTHYYWVINAILLLSVSFWINSIDKKEIFPLLFKGIIFFAVAESVIVIMQYGNLLPSASKYFSATGTWVNPNVTAMFLTMIFPVILFRLVDLGEKRKKLYLLFFFTVTIALVLLKCRTAIIGAVVAAGIIVNFRYCLFQRIKFKYSGLKLAVLGLVASASIIGSGYIFYKSKQESADGRKLVWKISADMVSQNPVSGYGYGSFERVYNLSQADYFLKGKGSETEKANASFVRMAYNEYLQTAVEGGIIGLILFLLLLAMLLFGSTHKILISTENSITPEIAAYAGIVAFAVMSLFNFTVQAIPVMSVFIVYISIAGKNYKQIYLPLVYKTFKQVAVAVFMVIVFFVAASQISLAKAYATNKTISNIIREGKSKSAIVQLTDLQTKLQLSDTYWINYGNSLLQQGEIKNAIEKYKSALNLQPYYQTYLLIGECYQKIKIYDSAAFYGNSANYHAPGRLKPKYFLMNLFAEVKDTINALRKAKEIIYSDLKIQTDAVVSYKNDATVLYKKFTTQ